MQHELLPSKSGHTYNRGSALLAEAAKGFGVDVDGQKEREWNVILRTIHHVDSMLDSTELAPTDCAERIEAFKNELLSNREPTHNCQPGCLLCEFAEIRYKWTDEQRCTFTNVVSTMQEVSHERKATTKPGKLAKLSAKDGRVSAEAVIFNERDDRSKSAFDDWIRCLFAAGTVVDAAIDLRSDFNNKITAVRPTLRNRAVIAAHALPYAPRFIRGTKPRVVKNLASSFAAVANGRK